MKHVILYVNYTVFFRTGSNFNKHELQVTYFSSFIKLNCRQV